MELLFFSFSSLVCFFSLWAHPILGRPLSNSPGILFVEPGWWLGLQPCGDTKERVNLSTSTWATQSWTSDYTYVHSPTVIDKWAYVWCSLRKWLLKAFSDFLRAGNHTSVPAFEQWTWLRSQTIYSFILLSGLCLCYVCGSQNYDLII